MIPTEARRLMELYKATATNTESDTVAEANIAHLVGMIGYAAACGHITPIEHSNEWVAIKLIRAQRANARRAVAA
ncbi:hypothetical protein D3C78_943930 [compost metagenome]